MSESSFSGCKLAQNFPNPVNKLTTIRYTLIIEGTVSLKVYSLQGETVATLVSQKQQAGNYEITLDAANLSDGFYYYELKSGDVSLSRKLVVSKRK